MSTSLASPAVGRPGARGRRLPRRTALSLVGLFVAWQLLSLVAGSNTSDERTVPGIVDIANALPRMADFWNGGLGVESPSVTGQTTWQAAVLGLLSNTFATAARTISGVLLGISVGLAAAVVVSWSQILRGMFATVGHFARMLPLLAMAPLFALWFGNTERGAVLFVAFVAFSLVFPIAITAIQNVPGHHAQYAASLGSSPRMTYLGVVLPAALPELRSAIMLAFGFGWSAAIAVEYLGYETGLGHVVQSAEYFGRTNVLALVAVIALLLAAASLVVTNRVMNWATRWAE